jgi:hypothetical protein
VDILWISRSASPLKYNKTWKTEPRKVTKALTVQYGRVLYLQDDTPEHRNLIDPYIDVWEYPDGRIELRADGRILTCRQYDRLAEIDQGAIVEHKRLAHVLQVSQAIQAQRDNRRIGKAPSRTHRRAATRAQGTSPGKKKQLEFTQADVEQVIVDLAQQRKEPLQPRKPGRRSARDLAADVSALPVQAPSFDTT